MQQLEQTVRQHDMRLDAAAALDARTSPPVGPTGVSLASDTNGGTSFDIETSPKTVISLNVQGPQGQQQVGEGTTDGMAIALIDGEDSGYFGTSHCPPSLDEL